MGKFKILLLVSILGLQACTGFKPRGSDSLSKTPLAGLSVYISEKSIPPGFSERLRMGLIKNGARLVAEKQPETIVIAVADLKEDKTVSAYSSVRQVKEFNHFIELGFTAQLWANSATQSNPMSSSVRAERSQIYDSRYVLGVSEEELAIRDELRDEAVRLLSLRLGVVR